MTVIIKETTGINAERDGYKAEVKNLTEAKRLASRRKAFHGTYLRIEDENGNFLAIRHPNGYWENIAR